MASHHKGGKDHLAPKGGAPERGTGMRPHPPSTPGAAPQRGEHGHRGQQPPTGKPNPFAK